MTRKKFSLCYKSFTVASLLIGIVLNLWNTKSIVAMLSYYTLQSNIICLIVFLIFEIQEMKQKEYKNEIYYLVKGGIIIMILITAVVYRFALAPGGFEMTSLKQSVSNKIVANFLVHTLSPILVLFDYILFDEKGKFKKYYPMIWIFIPLQYVIYVYTYSASGGEFYSIGGSRKYAYPFLDYEMIGYNGVIVSILFLAIAILILSYVLILYDNLRGKKKRAT